MSEPSDPKDGASGLAAADRDEPGRSGEPLAPEASAPSAPPVAAESDRGDERAPAPEEPGHATEASEIEVAGGEAEASGEADATETDDAGPSEAGETEAPEAEGVEGAEGATNGDKPKRKRKRRRRRKKDGTESSAGTETSPGAQEAHGHDGQAGHAGHAPRPPRPPKERKDPSHVPFGRFFEGPGRRHAFSVGEIVAGRVARVEHGAILVDLFGKALAVVDELEPREVEMPAPHHVPVMPADVEAPPHDAPAATEAAPDVEAADALSDEAHADAAAAVEAEAAEEAERDDSHSEVGAPAPAADAAPAPASERAPESSPPEAPAEPAAPPPPPRIGDIFKGRVGAISESGHIALVNRLIDVKTAREEIETARAERKRVQGLVYGFNRGGFDVLVRGVRAFCPASGMSLHPIDEPEEVIGHKLEFSLPPQKGGTQGIVVSRRSILEREQRKLAKELLRSLEPGQRIKGRVTHVREFGVFVDVGGVEGLVHQSELSFDRNVKPGDVAKPGDEVEVMVLRAPEVSRSKDTRHDRLSLSLKALEPDPWDQHGDVLSEGTVQKGRVARVAEFGAFIELVPGIEGLLHVSELGRDVKHAGHVVKPGDELDVVVERVDRKARRISLSRLSPQDAKALADGQLAEPGQKPKVVRPGAHVTVKVERVEHHGLHVQIEGVLGRRGRGYIPNSEMGTDRGTDHRKLFPFGTKIDVKVLSLDRDGGLRCSRKAFLADEEKRAVSDYRREAAKQGLGTFGDLLRAKLGASANKQ